MAAQEEVVLEDAVAGEATLGDASAPEAPLTFDAALQEVLRRSLMHDGLARGLKEATKALDRRQAHLCIISNSCDEPMYKKLVGALCKEHGVHLIKVDNSKLLGEWAGLAKLDAEGQVVKVVKCSCVVVKKWGERSTALEVVLDKIKSGAQ
eukprot:GABV01002947.1.p3 GENE.GABV01002947.1~~GABV01002947.1.p3  ORF type:complete len:151 (-),score=68.16 GABV01002947.1:99-551(-)